MGDYADWAVEDEITENNWNNAPKKGKAPIHYNKAGLPSKACAANGVYNWLRSKYLTGAGKNTAYSTREDRIIAKYGLEVLHSEQKPRVLATIISKEHWPAFIKWVKENYTA